MIPLSLDYDFIQSRLITVKSLKVFFNKFPLRKLNHGSGSVSCGKHYAAAQTSNARLRVLGSHALFCNKKKLTGDLSKKLY